MRWAGKGKIYIGQLLRICLYALTHCTAIKLSKNLHFTPDFIYVHTLLVLAARKSSLNLRYSPIRQVHNS